MTPPHFDLQAHLLQMEDRIREDIADTRKDHQAQLIAHTALVGRVESLEEKAGWIAGGIASSLLGVLGLFFAWVNAKLNGHG